MRLIDYKQRLRDAFYERLERKTGWGKEEVKREFEQAGEQVILEAIEEVDKK